MAAISEKSLRANDRNGERVRLTGIGRYENLFISVDMQRAAARKLEDGQAQKKSQNAFR